jgi:PAS domain S-box-containing protein
MSGIDGTTASLSEEGRYRLLINSVRDYAIYMLNPEGRILTWNDGAERLKGYSEAEILGQHIAVFYTPEDLDAGAPGRSLTEAETTGRSEAEGWRVRKDGSRFWANVVFNAISEPGQALLGFAKVTRDLTERRTAEETLRRSEEQFRLLVQGVTDYAIFMLNPDGIVTSWNAGAERIKGYSQEEIIGQHFSRFYTEQDRADGLPDRGLRTAAREGRFEHEGWRRRKDGTQFWANVVIDRLLSPEGKLTGFAKVTRDITQRREAQKQLEEAREALFQAQKLEAIGQLTGGVAHDFNNLLMVIISSLELAQKRQPSARIAPLIENAVEAAKRGATLTSRLLAFARRQKLAISPVDVPDLVRGMTELLQHALGPAITIEVRFPLGLPRVCTDPSQLEAALMNVAVNARDAMPTGGTIVIAAHTVEWTKAGPDGMKPGRYVKLSIVDDGEGMDAATLSRATEPFFTTKGVGKGTGLGLSMAKGLAEQSGGRLVVVSEKGVGTTIELWLPLVPGDHVEAKTARAQLPEQDRPTGLRILAVDDDMLVLMSTTAMLEELGHVALSATSGRDAIHLLRHEAVDIVITDQAMPGMTGSELAEAIAAEKPEIPVILATGYAELPSGTAEEFLRLSKPFNLEELSAAIVARAPRGVPGSR